jgi:hypothetical protein
VLGLLATIALAPAFVARAQADAAAPPPPPQPYSIPWQLRPVAVANVVRTDTSLAFYENPASGESGTTVASMLLGSYKVTPDLAPLVRLLFIAACRSFCCACVGVAAKRQSIDDAGQSALGFSLRLIYKTCIGFTPYPLANPSRRRH